METNTQREQKTTNKNYSIALLMADMNDAKRVTAVFKQLGIAPFICRSEVEFFETCENEKPHFSIVDVKKMSPEFFKNPVIINNSLAITFFYNLSSKAKLQETYDIFNYGYINGHQDLSGQIKSILNRFNHVDRFRALSQNVHSAEKKFEDKMERIVGQVQKLKEKDFYNTFYRSVCARLDNEREKSDDFITAISRVFSTIKEIKQYTVLELSASGHKLIAPKVYFDKYKEIPSLWLGRSCAQGIEFFAQNMASQVCLELIGGDLMSILIKGQQKNPDLMLFLQVEDDDFIANFSWETFETYLSGLYCYFLLRESTVNQSVQEYGNTWSLFSLADELGNGSIPSSRIEGGLDRYSLLSIHFERLVDRVLGNSKERFFWHKFFGDFFNGFGHRKELSFKLYSAGVKRVILLIDKKDEEHIKRELELYSKKFPYWRYFEQPDQVLKDNFSPQVRYVDLSLLALAKLLNGDVLEEVPERKIRPQSSLTEQTM